MNVNEFAEWLNHGTDNFNFTDKELAEYEAAVSQSIKRQFTLSSPSRDYRVSSLGKPAICQALTKLGYGTEYQTANKLRYTYHTGDVFEAYLLTLAKKAGLRTYNEQREVNFNGILGHIDAELDDFVLEVKTMSPYYYDKFVVNPNDDRGYITQLSVYSDCLDKPGVWLCVNKATSEVTLVPLTEEVKAPYLKRAKALVPLLKGVKSIDDALAFTVPKPVDELRYRKPTGRLVLPENIKWSELRSCLYDLVDGEKYKQYVVGIPDKEVVKERLANFKVGE